MSYNQHMQSMTSSFRISKELNRRLSHTAQRCGKGKNAIIIEALSQYLSTVEREWLAAEARRQSGLVSRNEREHDWYELADISG